MERQHTPSTGFMPHPWWQQPPFSMQLPNSSTTLIAANHVLRTGWLAEKQEQQTGPIAVFLHFPKNIGIITSIRPWPLPSVFLPVSFIMQLVFDAIFLIYWLPLSVIQTELQWGMQNLEDSYIWAVQAHVVLSCQIVIFMMTVHFSSSGLQIEIYSFRAFRNSCWRTMSGIGGSVKNWQNSCWPQ